MRIIKQFSGQSGSRVLLIRDKNRIFVRKFGNVKRNVLQLDILERLGIRVPRIYHITGEYYDMEFIRGYDMKTYLLNNRVDELRDFIMKVLHKFAENAVEKDFTHAYEQKLDVFPWHSYSLPFKREELLEKLPKRIPVSHYHGDLTLENIIYSDSGEFILIDPLTTEYQSYVFDIAKLRQDLECGWFVRGDHKPLYSKLASIHEAINVFKLSKDSTLLLLMLMRVLPYSHGNEDKHFLLEEISKLWKS